MRYLDTSLLVAALTNEAATGRVQAWLGKWQSDSLAISEWVITEFAAALSMKLRTRQIDEKYRARAVAEFTKMTANAVAVLNVTAAHFKVATRLAGDVKLALRAGDALHLAIANEQGVSLCTLDKQLAKAGKILGVSTELV
jgi:predicted nucleic acid-binding protein